MSNAIQLDHVEFDYGGGFALSIPSLALAKGEMALISGGSGSGKSTLLWIVAGLLRARRGSIMVAGERIDGVSESAADRIRARRIGLVFQTHHLLPSFTAQENVSLALMAAGEPERDHARRSRELLAKLGIERPDAAVSTMSVGQQQRVAVARAIVCAPAVVLADEPTASLDEANAMQAMDLIQQACRDAGAALLCASHDRAMQSRFQRVIEVDSFAASARANAKSGTR
ncbi:MAG: ATP-binding cassette domain-containing protein [Planctomycetes bacterium]|nr:ATP-binding cassette domain-containing protein [Planctomycetota bacterium]